MRTKGIFLSNRPEALHSVWRGEQKCRLREHIDIPDMVVGAEDITGMAENLHDVEVVFSTWGMPSLTSAQLDLLPRLRAVFYAAGSVKSFATPLLERGIIVASAWTANAIPVAEYTLSQILFGLKAGWQHVRAFQDKPGPESWRHLEIREDSNSTVGIVSLGQIGCKVCELLEPFALYYF